PEGLQGQNIARTIALLAGMPNEVPGQTVNRYCSSGIQTIAHAANQIKADQADILVAGGIELMSAVPMGGNEPTNNPILQDEDSVVSYPMSLTAEMVAETYKDSREEQDPYAVQSHARAAKAQREGKFEYEIISIEVNKVDYNENGPVVSQEVFKD